MRCNEHWIKIELKLPIENADAIKKAICEAVEDVSPPLLLKYQDPEDQEFYILTTMGHLPPDCQVLQATSNSQPVDSTDQDMVNPTYWNLKPTNPAEKWETKKGAALVYQRLLLRADGKNVVADDHDLIRKLTFLMQDRFGLPLDNVVRAFALYNEDLANAFKIYWRTLYTEHRNSPSIFKKSEWIDKSTDLIALQKFKFLHHYTEMAQSFNWNYVAVTKNSFRLI